jgi:hypothetical protein
LREGHTRSQDEAAPRIGWEDPGGLWNASTLRMIIKRPQLSPLTPFAGTVLHEVTPAKRGLGDVNRDFEWVLTDFPVRAAERAMR